MHAARLFPSPPPLRLSSLLQPLPPAAARLPHAQVAAFFTPDPPLSRRQLWERLRDARATVYGPGAAQPLEAGGGGGGGGSLVVADAAAVHQAGQQARRWPAHATSASRPHAGERCRGQCCLAAQRPSPHADAAASAPPCPCRGSGRGGRRRQTQHQPALPLARQHPHGEAAARRMAARSACPRMPACCLPPAASTHPTPQQPNHTSSTAPPRCSPSSPLRCTAACCSPAWPRAAATTRWRAWRAASSP